MRRDTLVLHAVLLTVLVFCSRVFASEDWCTVVEETPLGLIIECTLPEYTIADVDGTDFQQLRIQGGGSVQHPGAPDVPMTSILVAVPDEGRIRTHAVAAQQKRVHELLLAPVPVMSLSATEGGAYESVPEYIPDHKAYSEDVFSPAETVMVDYTGYLRGRRVAKLNVYPVRYNPVSQTAVITPKVLILVTFGVRAAVTAENLLSGTAGRSFQNIFNRCLINSESVYASRAHREQILPAAAAWSDELRQSPFAVKAIIEQPGMYRITHAQLRALGVNLSGLTHANLRVANQGREIAVYTSGSGAFTDGDSVVFYAEEFKSLYSKQNVYWVYQGASGGGRRMDSVSGAPVSGYTQAAAFQHTLHAEEDNIIVLNLPKSSQQDERWFWDKLSINEPPLARDYPFTLNALEKGRGGYDLTVVLRGETDTRQDPDHHTRVYINNTLVDDFYWDGQVELQNTTAGIPPALFAEGSNTLTIEAVADTGAVVDSYYFDRFSLTCWKKFIARNEQFDCLYDTTTGVGFRIEGFANDAIQIFDVTDHDAVRRVTGSSVSAVGSGYAASFEYRSAGLTSFRAVSPSGYLSPARMVVDAASNLRSPRADIDYIIITPDEFHQPVQRLQNHRRSKGLKVETVKVQDVYDEFSYGIKDAQAIKDFLAYAYRNWNSAGYPEYVLLVGDATYDYRDDLGMYVEGKIDYIPTYITQTAVIGSTPVDNWFVCVDGDDPLPDMILGRLCVKTKKDLDNIIDKIITYERQPLQFWHGNVILAADNELLFESISNNLANLLPDGYVARKVYLNAYQSVAPATRDLVRHISSGAVITNYTGHGATTVWADEGLFRTPNVNTDTTYRNDVQKLTNYDKSTLVLVLNCLSGNFMSVNVDYSLAEEFVRAERKGAIAAIASSAAGYPSEHQVLARNIFNGFFKDSNPVAGSVFTEAKIKAYLSINSRDIVDTFLFFGDPALEIKLFDSSADLEMALLEPSDAEVLARFPAPVFTWNRGLYERCKVQFAYSRDFGPEETVSFPLMPFMFNRFDRFRPTLFIWSILRMMTMQNNSSLYWRVAAYDENFNQINATPSRIFTIEQ